MSGERDGTSGGKGSEAMTAARAIRETVRTSRHAEMLFEMVAHRLGDSAFVETANRRTRFYLFLREAPGSDVLVPWPLLVLDTRSRGLTLEFDLTRPGVPVAPRTRPGEAPNLRGLGPGTIKIHDGPDHVDVNYADDGRWLDCSHSNTRALPGVVAAIQSGSANPVELLAEFVAGIDLARHGAARVVVPTPLPGGVEAVWNCGLFAAREALFADRFPDPGWLAVDGYSGTVLTTGRTRDEALAAWRAEVERVRPEKPRPAAPSDGPREDSIKRIPVGDGPDVAVARMFGADFDSPWPEPNPESTPAALIRLEPCPYPSRPWGEWIRLLGRRGATVHALRRADPDGFTFVGERLVRLLDFDAVDAQLDGVELPIPLARPPEVVAEMGQRPTSTYRTAAYQLFDDETGQPQSPAHTLVCEGPEFFARELDGDLLRARVVRHRWLSVT